MQFFRKKGKKDHAGILDDSLLWRFLSCKWQNLSGGLISPVPTLCNIFLMLACHPLHQWTPSLESHIMYYLWLFYLRIFTKRQHLIPAFIFINTPQILHHFHFIFNPISILFFSCFLSPDYRVWAGSLRYFQPAKPG